MRIRSSRPAWDTYKFASKEKKKKIKDNNKNFKIFILSDLKCFVFMCFAVFLLCNQHAFMDTIKHTLGSQGQSYEMDAHCSSYTAYDFSALSRKCSFMLLVTFISSKLTVWLRSSV